MSLPVEIASLVRQLHEEQAANQRLHEALEVAQTQLDELRQEHLVSVREHAQTYTSLPLDALLTIFNAMARAGTGQEVLTHLVRGLASEFSRVILFTVHDTRLDAIEQYGFDFGNDISKLSVPLTADSFLGAAVRSGRLETAFPLVHGESSAQLPLGGTPACAVAIPFVVGGAAVALVYADDSDAPEFAVAVPQTRAKFAEILQRHALLLLQQKIAMGDSEPSAVPQFAKLPPIEGRKDRPRGTVLKMRS